MRRSRGQWGKCVRPVLLSRLINGRLSPMNLSRPSSFATANAPEASLGSREEDGSVLASLQRNVLRAQARHRCSVTAKKEELSPIAAEFSGLQQSCSASMETDASGDDVFCACLRGTWSIGTFPWVT